MALQTHSPSRHHKSPDNRFVFRSWATPPLGELELQDPRLKPQRPLHRLAVCLCRRCQQHSAHLAIPCRRAVVLSLQRRTASGLWLSVGVELIWVERWRNIMVCIQVSVCYVEKRDENSDAVARLHLLIFSPNIYLLDVAGIDLKRINWVFTMVGQKHLWLIWLEHRWDNLKFRIKTWWFWYSPPWSRTRRCPGCAGSRRIYNSYDERDCDVCHGTGVVSKH